MNFGFGVGDFLAAGQLAWKVYTACQEAPEQFRSIAQEVQSLHAVLKTADEALSIQSLSLEQNSDRNTILSGCQAVLEDLEKLVEEYSKLEKKKKWGLSRLKFGSKDLPSLRARLSSSIGMLNTFIIACISIERQSARNEFQTLVPRPTPSDSEIHVYQYPDIRIPHYVAREGKLKALDREFENGRKSIKRPPIAILLGMGGAGKTQLALEYCRKAKEEKQYDSIFWIDASSPSTLIRSFELVAGEIYGAEQKFPSTRSTIAAVKRKLESCKTTWLMVFDNFDRPDKFSKPISTYWPETARGAIIFTSRHEGSRLLGSSIEIAEMSTEEGIELLANRIGISPTSSDKAHLQNIVSILGNLALAIDQAGAYILQHHLGLSLMDYSSLYHSRKKHLLEETPDSSFWHYSKKPSEDAPSASALSVFTTWEMSFESIKGSPDQVQKKGLILSLAAFLGNEGISEDMFQRYAENAQPLPDYIIQLTPGSSWDKFEFRNIISEFKKLSLIQSLSYGANGIHFTLHPLVRDWAQLRLNPKLQARLSIDATVLVSLSLPDPDGPKPIDVSGEVERMLLQHMDDCAQNCASYVSQNNWLGVGQLEEAGYRFAAFYSYAGGPRYSDAERIFCRALDWRNDNEIAPNSRTVRLLLRLAWAYEHQDRYKECKDLSLRALNLSKMFLNKDDPAAWYAQRRMGMVHFHEQHTEEALILLKMCYENQLEGLGKEHQATLSTIIDLISVYTSKFMFDLAEYYARVALEGYISTCGLNSPFTLDVYLRLARIFIRRGNLQDAETLLLKNLERGKTNFGCSSYRVTLINEKLVGVYRLQNRYSEAMQLSVKNRATREHIYGRESSQVVASLIQLARINIEWAGHGADNRGIEGDSTYKKPESLLLEAQVTLQNIGGPDQWEEQHWVKLWLGRIYSQQKEYEKAEALINELLEDIETKGSPISSVDLLWQAYFLYEKQGKRVEMTNLLEKALPASRKLLGSKNINMLEFLERARVGYDFLKSEKGIDRISLEVLTLWDEAGGSKYHDIKVDEVVVTTAIKTSLP